MIKHDHSIRIDSGWRRRQERETCGVLHGSEPNVHRSLPRKGLRRDEAQDCSVQTHVENTPKHSVLGHIEGSSEEGIAVLSNAIKRDHPSQHFTCDVHREGGDQEVRRTFYRKTYQCLTGPQRIVLKPNLHHESPGHYEL